MQDSTVLHLSPPQMFPGRFQGGMESNEYIANALPSFSLGASAERGIALRSIFSLAGRVLAKVHPEGFPA